MLCSVCVCVCVCMCVVYVCVCVREREREIGRLLFPFFSLFLRERMYVGVCVAVFVCAWVWAQVSIRVATKG